MPRSIVVGNGNVLACINQKNLIEDLYFPYVGMENHIAFEHWHRLGVHVDSQFSWLHDEQWQHDINYVSETLVTDSVARNESLLLKIGFNDFVYPTEDFMMRKLTVKNEADYDREVKLYFNQDFHLYGDKQQDTAFYEPEHQAMVHYRKRRYFWISGMQSDQTGIDSFTTGKSEYNGLQGTWKDAEDGHLHEHPIEQGSVDSTVSFHISLKANEERHLYVWICAGKTLKEVELMHGYIMSEKPEKLLQNTINYWISWVNKETQRRFVVDQDILKEYKQSLLIIRTQVDNRGAIIAANDSDIMKFNKDNYSYMWPRDGAWISLALDRAGYGEITKRFFNFCAESMTEDGYLLQKYNPDQSVGSSWHSWYKDGDIQLPIQEDETAIVTHALWEHWQRYKDIEFVQDMYEPLIRAAGNFMLNFVDDETGLPLPSYDLWEETRGIHLYTASCVYAGLEAAYRLSAVLGHFNHSHRYKSGAEGIKKAILEHLYDEKEGHFLKKVTIDMHTRAIYKDYGFDASMQSIWMMGVLPADDERVVRTNQLLFEKLHVPGPIGGLARNEDDYYQRVHGDYGSVQGNPWLITTLWHAQWLMAIAKKRSDLDEPKKWIEWAMKLANPSGIMPEQVNPFNGDPLSVAPLTWSHSTFVDTVLKYNEKLIEFGE